MTASIALNIKSILLVDDDQDFLELFSTLLSQKLSANVVMCKYPTQAALMANEEFFDLIALDVTMDYHGSPFGGLDLYKIMLNRYGKNSLVAYSQYITDDLLKRYNYSFNFIEKGTNILHFVDELVNRVMSLREKQTCFVAMPFDSKYDGVYEVIRDRVEHHHYKCVRVDKQRFTKSIVEKVFEEISHCKFMIFLAADRNPNAFYECGFALALGKEIITVTDYYHSLPFDIRDKNAIEYREDLDSLRGALDSRLEDLTKVQ